MNARVNARLSSKLACFVTAAVAPAGCASSEAQPVASTGSSRIEVVYLDPQQDATTPLTAKPTQKPTSENLELGDGTSASEMLAAARRLLGLTVSREDFERHVLASALVDRAAFVPAGAPAVGDLVTKGPVVAVVEGVDGFVLRLVGLRAAGPVVRWIQASDGLTVLRP